MLYCFCFCHWLFNCVRFGGPCNICCASCCGVLRVHVLCYAGVFLFSVLDVCKAGRVVVIFLE